MPDAKDEAVNQAMVSDDKMSMPKEDWKGCDENGWLEFECIYKKSPRVKAQKCQK